MFWKQTLQLVVEGLGGGAHCFAVRWPTSTLGILLVRLRFRAMCFEDALHLSIEPSVPPDLRPRVCVILLPHSSLATTPMYHRATPRISRSEPRRGSLGPSHQAS